jgi:glycine oxidase
VRAFGIAARDRYPGYLAWLAERTGVVVPLNREGILDVALDDATATRLRERARAGARWLDERELADLEPALAPARGAVLHPDDGAVDNVRLMDALERLAASEAAIEVVRASATEVDLAGSRPRLVTSHGERFSCGVVVLAAGAWSPHLRGLPRSLPIEPVRGQMVAFAAAPLRHVAYGGAGYLVPRADGRTLAGSTMERVFFDAEPTEEGIRAVTEAGERLCPALAGAQVVERWAGLRPVTPDLLPILGREPDAPALVYACGHSRNGVLMAPLTGDCVAALVAGERPPADLTPFGIHRFES